MVRRGCLVELLQDHSFKGEVVPVTALGKNENM